MRRRGRRTLRVDDRQLDLSDRCAGSTLSVSSSGWLSVYPPARPDQAGWPRRHSWSRPPRRPALSTSIIHRERGRRPSRLRASPSREAVPQRQSTVTGSSGESATSSQRPTSPLPGVSEVRPRHPSSGASEHRMPPGSRSFTTVSGLLPRTARRASWRPLGSRTGAGRPAAWRAADLDAARRMLPIDRGVGIEGHLPHQAEAHLIR